MTIQEQIKQQQEKLIALEAAANTLPVLEEANGYALLMASVGFATSAPHNPELWKAHREILEAAGWVFMREIRWTDDGVLGMFYCMGDIELNTYYRPSLAGSTCKLNLIGYEEPKPIYEVTCNEA